MRVGSVELDLEVFSGPFDLLLTLILREEIDLLEVDLTQIVLTYIEHLEVRGELDLEATTEFLVLIAALLELKSRLILAEDTPEEIAELAPEEAAEELVARMLEHARYRQAAVWLKDRLEEEVGYLYRSAPLPKNLRRASLQVAEATYDPALLGAALGGLLKPPPKINLRHMAVPRVSLPERLRHLRELLKRGRFSFDQAVQGADRMTVAVTLFGLLELYKAGEASWQQAEPFGEIMVDPT